MNFLGIDIGFGTTDILIIFNEKIFKMVLPTRGQQLAQQVINYQGDIYVGGIEMGGNPLAGALKTKLQEGFRIYITKEAAKTINYDLNKVKEKGFEIISEKKFESVSDQDGLIIQTADFLPDILNKFLLTQGIEYNFDIIGIAVQDHGKAEGSSTQFRGFWIQKQLEKDPVFDSFLFSELQVPPYLLRMRTIIEYFREFYPKSRIYVMDTVFAAIQGAIYSQPFEKNLISMDIGNGHTAAATHSRGEIYGYFEFHTSAITPSRLEWAIEKLVQGNLTNEEIWQKGGHGALTRKPCPNSFPILVTGPHRQLITQTHLPYSFANPLGDMMITGCVGLALGIEKREKIKILKSI